MSLISAMLATLLWGGLVAADTAAFLQLLLSQPFVAGCVTGALWGRLELGCEVGAILQLVSLGTLPLGGRTPEDFPIGAVVGVAVAAILDRTFPIASAQGGPILYGLGVAFLVALLGKPILAWQRRRNERLARWVEDELASGNLAAIGRAQWAGVAQAFAIGVAWTALALAIAALAGQPLFRHQGVAFGRAWHLGSPLIWGFGAGLVTRGMARGKRPGLLFWTMLVAFLAIRLLGQE